MKTGSLRTRVTLTSLALLLVVLAGVIAAVTIAYRSGRQGDLTGQLRAAADQFLDTPPGAATKILIGNLARQGIAVDFRPGSPDGPADTPAASDHDAVNPGELSSSLVVFDQVLADGTRVTLSASNAAIDGDVRQLLTIEIAGRLRCAPPGGASDPARDRRGAQPAGRRLANGGADCGWRDVRAAAADTLRHRARQHGRRVRRHGRRP